MDKLPNENAAIVDILINKFHVSSVSQAEASKPHDCVVTHLKRTNRIDRQGPAFNGSHAKFAVQVGTATYAGIHMPVNTDFPIEVVRAAFRASLAAKKYQKLSFS